MCRYYGNIKLAGAASTIQGAYTFSFRAKEIKDGPMHFEGILNCKARTINSFKHKNVRFDEVWDRKHGYKILVHTTVAVKKDEEASVEYDNAFEWGKETRTQ